MPDASITGNHDQWGGQNFPVGGGPLAAQALVPKTLPYVISQPLPNGRRLLLAGIDTDADVSPRGLWRLFALGSFQSQLVALEQMLPPWKEDDIRVLLAHHSLARTGLALRMDDASKAALKVFLADLQFSVLLTGHTHERLFTNSSVSGRGRARTVQELTCGTTTQHDQVPYGWRSAFGRFPQRNWPPNMLLMHQLFAKPDGGTGWEARPYVRIQGGFKALPSISFDV
jgi:hypothetical protein